MSRHTPTPHHTKRQLIDNTRHQGLAMPHQTVTNSHPEKVRTMIRKPRLSGAVSAVLAAFLFCPMFVVSPATAGSAAREDSPEPTTPTTRLGAGQTFSEA